jgi:PTH1 family peptidyl-tRNA hydrolase
MELKPRVIVGLGNPGTKYLDTRHNVGFRALDELAGGEPFKKEGKGYVAKKFIGGRNVYLVKPDTFMNLSGEYVQPFLTRHKIKIEECLVLVDDIQLDYGVTRIRLKGSHGGQNGLRDIIARMGPQFPRLRLGVGKVPPKYDVSRWVLGVPESEDYEKIKQAEYKCSEIIETIMKDGYSKAMSQFNS